MANKSCVATTKVSSATSNQVTMVATPNQMAMQNFADMKHCMQEVLQPIQQDFHQSMAKLDSHYDQLSHTVTILQQQVNKNSSTTTKLCHPLHSEGMVLNDWPLWKLAQNLTGLFPPHHPITQTPYSKTCTKNLNLNLIIHSYYLAIPYNTNHQPVVPN